MIFQHFLLGALWISYCTLHSLLASHKVKDFIKGLMKNSYKYYRLIYSFFAFITLAFVLWYQFSIDSFPLIFSAYRFIPAIFFLIPGSIMMCICIKKYFYTHSGVQALEKNNADSKLEQTGIHKLVRHPLYLGTLLLIWGLFLFLPTAANLVSCTIIHLYVLAGITLEERKLYKQFGKIYEDYSQITSKLLPGINVLTLYKKIRAL